MFSVAGNPPPGRQQPVLAQPVECLDSAEVRLVDLFAASAFGHQPAIVRGDAEIGRPDGAAVEPGVIAARLVLLRGDQAAGQHDPERALWLIEWAKRWAMGLEVEE